MIVNNKNGDNLALEFSKLLNKSLKKKAEDQSAGGMILEDIDDAPAGGQPPEDEKAESMADDKFSSENFLRESHKASEASALTDSMNHSIDMMEDEYKKDLTSLVELDDEMPESESATVENSKAIMAGLGSIAKSLSKKGESFAADVVIAAAHEINEEMLKEAAKIKFVQDQLMKIAAELDVEGDNFSRDMVIATAKNL